MWGRIARRFSHLIPTDQVIKQWMKVVEEMFYFFWGWYTVEDQQRLVCQKYWETFAKKLSRRKKMWDASMIRLDFI